MVCAGGHFPGHDVSWATPSVAVSKLFAIRKGDLDRGRARILSRCHLAVRRRHDVEHSADPTIAPVRSSEFELAR